MFYYKYLLLFSLLLVIIVVVRYFFIRRENTSINLFINALKDENNGLFEEAVITYETALLEVNKIRVHTVLKNKIIEKLKTLPAFIEYKNNFH
jgi:hypothetical protein